MKYTTYRALEDYKDFNSFSDTMGHVLSTLCILVGVAILIYGIMLLPGLKILIGIIISGVAGLALLAGIVRLIIHSVLKVATRSTNA